VWDYAAGALVATEAGCVASGLRGHAPSEQLTFVAGTGLAAELGGLLERLGADRLSS
jgi:fructose-1,6-bisphosphatase/inositol monophosphatase family enzyme